MTLRYRVVEGRWAVCRLEPGAAVPEWADGPGFSSITRTGDELSIVCPEERVPAEVRQERGWACLQLCGPFAFNLTGVLAAVLAPLAEAGVPIFALSTFDTDWVLLPAAKLGEALEALEKAGHTRES